MQSHVAAAKAGVDSFTRTARSSGGPTASASTRSRPARIAGTEGVRRFTESGAGPGARGAATRSASVGHGADIAYQVLYFCSDAARFISGQVIAVDGAGTVDLLKLDLEESQP